MDARQLEYQLLYVWLEDESHRGGYELARDVAARSL
jgi:hypothetical protein